MTEILKSINDYFKLYSIMRKELSNINIELIIEKSFLEPMDILISTQFIIKQNQRNCEITVSASDSNVLDYLKAIKIVDFCSRNIDMATTLDAIENYTAMPIRRVEEESMFSYIDSTQKYFRSFCDGKDLSMLDLCLSELINNAHNHSHSSIGAYVFCQYYSSQNEIKLAVSDLGIGIPMSVNSFNKSKNQKELSSRECVIWALKENMTTKSIPQNMGKGLDIIKSFMGKTNLTWKLYTNDVLMNGYPSGIKYEENPISFFNGTLVQLNIKIDNLPDLEIIESVEWSF